MDEGIEKAPLRGRILAKMTAWKANNHTVGAGHAKWPFVGKRRADMESDPTEDVILEEAINKGRERRRKVAGGIYAAPTAL